ncbi:hypothetical protein ACQKJG_18270 [Priestia megaterium]|uniref:hypothetical protein n=1 Tax=Priestia megaterium TaxID=1404 RepID=UPI003D05E171
MNKLTFDQWLKTTGFLPHNEFKQTLIAHGFSLIKIHQMWKEVHRLYQTYLLLGRN